MGSYRILDEVNSPADLKVLSNDELTILAREIREEIIETTAVTGGHVASSLGAVEIILAVHSLIDAPKDKFIFDVGHQSYAHKLITGRRDQFSRLRSYQGISGFPKPSESEFDVHPSGHASDSLSVATGLAKARVLQGGDEKIVALIGDAALAGGMAFEALNYIGQEQLPLVIILNDNEMSISRNVGALVRHLGNLRMSSQYRDAREALQERLENSGALARGFLNFGKSVKESMKQFVVPQSMIFEQLGILCTAPFDGHDIAGLRELLSTVLTMDSPVLIHAVTKKGAGFEPAEKDPERFHGIGAFNPKTGESITPERKALTYTEVFGDALVKEAQHDPDIIAITAAMKSGTGLCRFAQEFPDRFIDVGISEEHALGMASGLAIAGKKPVVAIYSTFMQRAIDQLAINNALPNLNVVFALDRAGLVGPDGPTHHGVFDMVYTRMVPHLRVLAPSDEAELVNALHTALALGGPFAIRYPKAEGTGAAIPDEPEVLPVGVSRTLREGSDASILAFGREVSVALEAASNLAEQGKEIRVVDMRWVKPLDRDAIRQAASTGLVVTLEDGATTGGAGEGVLKLMADEGLSCPTLVMGIPDQFVLQGDVDLLNKEMGLDAESIAASIAERLSS